MRRATGTTLRNCARLSTSATRSSASAAKRSRRRTPRTGNSSSVHPSPPLHSLPPTSSCSRALLSLSRMPLSVHVCSVFLFCFLTECAFCVRLSLLAYSGSCACIMLLVPKENKSKTRGSSIFLFLCLF